ncbi:hypothetical protein [Bradyrhizobium sp. USDA 10063]
MAPLAHLTAKPTARAKARDCLVPGALPEVGCNSLTDRVKFAPKATLMFAASVLPSVSSIKIALIRVNQTRPIRNSWDVPAATALAAAALCSSSQQSACRWWNLVRALLGERKHA